jgi:transcriptional regulator of acetoin/glycerol metabolism
VEAAVLAGHGPTIELHDFPDAVIGQPRRQPDDERARLLDALRRTRGNRTHAARALGMARGTLRARMAAHGITDADVRPPVEPAGSDRPLTTP